MGTLDGKGHKIKNYVGIGLFDNAKNATFKNIIMTNVTIEGTQSAAALVYSAEKCTFTNITVSGSTKTDGVGIVFTEENCNFTDCTSKVDANIKAEKEIWICFAGISQGSSGSTFKNCKNKGNLKVTSESVDDLSYKLYGITRYAKSMENCSNSGKKSGSESTSWKPYQSKAKKVSSITFGNCSKLSSKYWTYSNKHKRLILKNNKEA